MCVCVCAHRYGGEKAKVPTAQIQLQISRHTSRRKRRRVSRSGLAVLEEICRKDTGKEEEDMTQKYTAPDKSGGSKTIKMFHKTWGNNYFTPPPRLL